MDPSDYNLIRPVDSLQNVTSLSQTQERQERKRRQEKNKDHPEKQGKESQEKPLDIQTDNEGILDQNHDPHIIDYRA